jgi:hypothetical protein
MPAAAGEKPKELRGTVPRPVVGNVTPSTFYPFYLGEGGGMGCKDKYVTS